MRLIVLGAILRFAVTMKGHGVILHTTGMIPMMVGAIGAVPAAGQKEGSSYSQVPAPANRIAGNARFWGIHPSTEVRRRAVKYGAIPILAGGSLRRGVLLRLDTG